jgi:uncharacterized ion transporter superfamily protein YfcC
MKNRSILKTAIFYTICFIILVVLIEATWGLTAGVLVGANLGSDKVTQEEVTRIMKEKGVKAPDISKANDEDWYKNLPPDVKKDIENVVKPNLQAINWFGVTLAVSAFVFAVVGFLCGFLNRAFIPIGIIVVLSFLVDNPVVRFPHAKALGIMQKTIIVLAQFMVCYLFGYLGALLGRKRDRNNSA